MAQTVYCRNCGSALTPDARFCSACGAAVQAAAQSGDVPEWMVAGVLLLFFPLGIPLMWAGTRWSTDVKLAITAFFIPPLWFVVLARQIWRIAWSRQAKIALIVTIVAVLGLVLLRMGSVTAAIWVAGVLAVLGALWVMTAPSGRASKAAPEDGLRRVIETNLDTCHDLIAQIEDELTRRPLDTTDPTMGRYRRALEMRTEGVDLLERARTRPDLVAAEARVSRAMDDLRATHDHLTYSLP